MKTLEVARELREEIRDIHDDIANDLFYQAHSITSRVTRKGTTKGFQWDQTLDRVLTSKWLGFPVMIALLTVVFWFTIEGASVPSELLATTFFRGEEKLANLFAFLGSPEWLTGFFVHGMYRAVAWVVAVMFPPMAIFFPIFTLLENFGYLPRVAFNLDRLFKKAGAHGKQALTMSMGFGCNAAGVIACRIIDSPRERLIAIITNNFVPCNGRWPTLILMATVFIAAAFPPSIGSIVAASTLVSVVLLGVLMTLLVSGALTRTLLKGEPSAFALELPPFRKPQILPVIYTSLIDRTLFVLMRAVIMAVPCGAVAWLFANIYIGDQSIMVHVVSALDPIGRAIGLDGVILLAYIVAIPANEIVIPTMLMAYMNLDRMTDIESTAQLKQLLVGEHGWTVLTAVCLMLFSLLHNPCSTTIWTIYKETGSKKWTWLASLIPLAIGFVVCFIVAQGARLLGFV